MAERTVLLLGAAGPAGQALRQRLWEHRDGLGDGLSLPLDLPTHQTQAVARFVEGGSDAEPWPELVRAVAALEGTAVLVNGARLAKLGPERAAEAVASLGQVEVILPVPVAAWAAQQRWQARLLGGDTTAWEAWLSRAPSFLASWDPLPALESWSGVAHVHLLAGGSADELAALLVPVLAASYPLTAPARITGVELAGSLGTAAVELLRRFNTGRGTTYDETDYRRYVQPFLVQALVDGTVSRPRIPGTDAYVERLSRALRGPLAGRVTVHGSVDALAAADASTPYPDDDELLEAGLAAWVRQLESVEKRLDQGLGTRRARARELAATDG